MAAWHAANGDIPALRAELATQQDQKVLDDVLFRGLQYNNAKVVGIALDHGANPMARWNDGSTDCRLTDASKPVLAAAAKRGWSKDCSRRAARP